MVRTSGYFLNVYFALCGHSIRFCSYSHCPRFPCIYFYFLAYTFPLELTVAISLLLDVHVTLLPGPFIVDFNCRVLFSDILMVALLLFSLIDGYKSKLMKSLIFLPFSTVQKYLLVFYLLPYFLYSFLFYIILYFLFNVRLYRQKNLNIIL